MKSTRMSRRPARIEPMEPRTLFSLVPTFSVLPVELVSTVKNNSSVTVTFTNEGAAKISGAYTATLYASTSPVFGAATDTFIKSANRNGAIAIGRSSAFKFSLSDFPGVPNDNYYLIAEISGNDTIGSAIAASGGTIPVAAPYVELSDTVTLTSPKNDQILPGKAIGLAVEIFNTGNVPATGLLLTDINLVSTTTDSVAAPIKRINLKAGAHQTMHLSEKIPLGFAPGPYTVEAVVDPNDSFNEPTLANNTASAGALTVLPPFPDILGIFTGPDVITRGPDKGNKPTIALDFTSEDQTTGNVIATGTLFTGVSTTFNFVGNISAKDVFTGTGSSAGSIFVATYKGKLVGHKLTGTVVNTDGNTGTFTLTD